MLFRQFVDEDLGCASYLVGDAGRGRGAAGRPRLRDRAVPRRGRAARRPDHARARDAHARRPRLRPRPARARARHPGVDPRRRGRRVSRTTRSRTATRSTVGVGQRVRCLHTPGHRPEHCCFLADSALLTGDSLFCRLGRAARPRRRGPRGRRGALPQPAPAARAPRRRRRSSPATSPARSAASGMSADPSSTIGAERRGNALLAIATVNEFVDEATGTATPRPPNMERIVELNRGPFLAASAAPAPVADANGATVLDVRTADAFAAGHVHGALNVPGRRRRLRDEGGVRAPPRRADRPARRRRRPRQSWPPGASARSASSSSRATSTSRRRLEPLEPVESTELEGCSAEPDVVDVIDVRELDERDTGFIPGSRHIPYRLLRALRRGRRRRQARRDDLRERPARGGRGQRARRRGRGRAAGAPRRHRRLAATAAATRSSSGAAGR